jgi:hypothetical protein
MNKIIVLSMLIITTVIISLSAQSKSEVYEQGITIPEINIPEIKIPVVNYDDDTDTAYVNKLLDILDKKFVQDLDEIASKNEKVYDKTIIKLNKTLSPKNKIIFSYKKKANDLKIKREIPIIKEEVRTIILSAKYQLADKEAKKEILAELEDALNNLFDLREELRRDEIQELEDRIRELKSILDIRHMNKDKIIQKRLWELTEDSKYINWDKYNTNDEF